MTSPDTRSLERRLGDWARVRLPFALAEFVMFVLKQGWACLFGGLLLLAIIATKLLWQPSWPSNAMISFFFSRWPPRRSSSGKNWRHGKKPA